jgi:hypothetical protein
MAVYIPYRGRLIAVETENDPHPDAVCPGDCPACEAEGHTICPRTLRHMENVADAWMVRDVSRRAG